MLKAGERQVGEVISKIHVGHVERYKFAAKRVKGFVLDAACGCGYGSSLLPGDVTGIDLEPEAIAYAEENYPGPRYLVDNVATHKGSYDWIVSLETLEHLPEPEVTLRNFREMADWLIVSTPNQDNYPFKVEQYLGDTFPHLRHYTPSELDELLSACGWRSVERFCQVEKTSPVSHGTNGKFIIFLCR